MDSPTCPRCGSPRWVSVSLDGGYTRRAQCVPCGAYHPGSIGPGWKSPTAAEVTHVRDAIPLDDDGTGFAEYEPGTWRPE